MAAVREARAAAIACSAIGLFASACAGKDDPSVATVGSGAAATGSTSAPASSGAGASGGAGGIASTSVAGGVAGASGGFGGTAGGGGTGAGAGGTTGAGGGAGSAGSGGMGGCQIVTPAPCPPGIMPGTAPDPTCSLSPPTITQPGSYPYSLASAQPDANLGCTYNYPDRRNVAFGICTETTKRLTVKFPFSFNSATGSLRSDCMTEELCMLAPATSTDGSTFVVPRFTPDTYPLVIEGYGPVSDSIEIDFEPITGLVEASDCCEAEQHVVYDGPLPMPSLLFASTVSAPFSTDPALQPSCTAHPYTTLTAFQVNSTAQVTLVSSATSGFIWGGVAVRSSCGGPELKCSSSYLLTLQVSPGAYYVPMSWDPLNFVMNNLDVIIETPPPPTTNLSCSSLQTITPSQSYLEDRIVGGTPDPNNPGRFMRYYSVTTTSTSNMEFGISSPKTKQGIASASVRAACADASTELASFMAQGLNQNGAVLYGVPAGTYYLVVSADEGYRYWVWAGVL